MRIAMGGSLTGGRDATLDCEQASRTQHACACGQAHGCAGVCLKRTCAQAGLTCLEMEVSAVLGGRKTVPTKAGFEKSASRAVPCRLELRVDSSGSALTASVTEA